MANERSVSWSNRDAVFGVVITAPAALWIALGHPASGLPLLIGSLPAAVIGLAPTRKQRVNLVIIGILFGLFIMLGSFIASLWWVAVPVMFLLAYGAARLASLKPVGMVALVLGVPLIGIGLSYAGLENSVRLGVLLASGSVIACIVSMLLPAYLSERRPAMALLPKHQAHDYGLRLGLAAAVAAGCGFALGVEHVGWIAGAALFVMRPNLQTEKLRALGRGLSVLVGALAASWLLSLDISAGWIAVVAAGDLVVAAATHKSSWYITPLFTTFLVFWVLLYGDASQASIDHRFWERMLETLLGIAIAYLFGIVWPQLAERKGSSKVVI